jgi:hypothetical protein
MVYMKIARLCQERLYIIVEWQRFLLDSVVVMTFLEMDLEKRTFGDNANEVWGMICSQIFW